MQTPTRLFYASSAQAPTTNAPAPSAPPPTSPPPRPRRRVFVLVSAFVVLAAVLLIQLLRYQLVPPDEIAVPAAEANDSNTRGLIVDRHGVPLAVNRYFYKLTATPANIETPAERHEVAEKLLDLFGLPYEKTYSTLEERANLQWADLAEAVTQEQVDRLNQEQAALWEAGLGPAPLHQVVPKLTTKRFYPQAELTSHLLGFIMPYGPVFGLEKYYNQFLVRGGVPLISADAQSFATLSTDVRRFLPSPVGRDLVLTIDAGIQWILREELQKGLTQHKAQSGTVIVMDPHTGAILGMVSLPDYDPNRSEEGYSQSLANPAVSQQYEPGSVFKIITMVAALDTGVITPTMIFNDTGSITLGERVYYNSLRNAYGDVTVTQALALSLNVVTVQIAQLLGEDDFYRYVRAFGFDAATNIDLADEINGAVKSRQIGNWSLSDLGANSFGQGIAVTPIQMLNATAVIANGGKLMQPYVVYARVMDDEVQYTQPVVVRQVLQPENAAQMAEMMAEIVEIGNSKAAVYGYRVAGKSGTAQIPIEGGYDENETIVTYVGFAPADDPQFVMLVKMERPDPTINQWASQTAAPVFSSIAKRLLDRLGIPPDDLRLAAVKGE